MHNKNNQPTFRRQRFLLAFIRQLRGVVTATDLQKLVFIHTMSGDSDYYDFIPYKYGSYSFQLTEDLDILRKDGFLSIEHTKASIHIMAIGEYPRENALRIATERGNELIRKAYREYPYYVINSEIVNRVFKGEELEQYKNTRHKYIKTEQMLFNIGYEGKSIESFVNILIQNDIRLICDVRKNPLSRKFGYSKSKLKHILEAVGIKYIHLPELGIESDKRVALETEEDYNHLFDDYAKSLPNLTSMLERVYTLLFTDIRIALMCYECDPTMCHRHVIRDYIVKTHSIRSIDL